MKKGDLVRFRKEVYPRKKRSNCGIWTYEIGVLVEYRKWEKIASILNLKNVCFVNYCHIKNTMKSNRGGRGGGRGGIGGTDADH